MTKKILLAALIAAAALPAAAAQLYRWVDAQGRVEWRDTPPPSEAGQVETRKVQGNLPPSGTLPYAMQQAAKNFPVTLWTASADCGSACDRAKSHLVRRGIPYAEKNGKADLEGLRKATGGLDVPVLFVGSNKLKGYNEGEWDRALDAAGYPSARTAP